jgi:hypothetical protein
MICLRNICINTLHKGDDDDDDNDNNNNNNNNNNSTMQVEASAAYAKRLTRSLKMVTFKVETRRKIN